jgi:hypothetical protein
MDRAHRMNAGRRGAPPSILAHGNDIVYVLTPPGVPRELRLVIRCDAEGELWASIEPRVPCGSDAPERNLPQS